jgi:hypothetical protein
MKQVLVSAVVAAVVTIAVVQIGGGIADIDFSPTVLSFTVDNIEDSIVDGSRYTGVYSKLLVSAENSVCYLTKVQFRGIESPDDSNICSIELDDFTGHWQVNATVEEGSVSEARCNASCLIWE